MKKTYVCFAFITINAAVDKVGIAIIYEYFYKGNNC